MKAFLLVDAAPDKTEEVAGWLRGLPEVSLLHEVHYGHFRLLAEIVGRTHPEVQAFIVNKVRYHPGVVQVREVEDESVPSILASEETPA